MKVLVIGPFPYPIDGCSNSNKVFLQNLKKRNIISDFIDTNTPIISNEQGRTFSFSKASWFLRKYANAYKIAKYDVVYFTPGQTVYGILKYAPFMLLCLLLRKPYIIHVHGNFLGKNYGALTGNKKKWVHFFISRAAAGIVITSSLRENFRGLLPDEKIFVVEYFVEDFLYNFQIAQKKDDQLRILYLSNLMKEKGVLDCLDALQIIQQKNIPFSALIAGTVEKGLQSEIDSRLQQLDDQVTYAGVIIGDAKVKALQEANVFILPTYYSMEGLPFSLLEAMAMGNIIVTTKHAGIPDVVTESNGFFVEKGSAKSIAACLHNINENLKSYVNLFSEHNKSYASSTFTEEKFTDHIFSVLETTVRRDEPIKLSK